MKEFKVLLEEKWFDVIDVNGHVGLKNKSMSVAVMPYEVDEFGMVKRIGLLKEYNLFREGDYCNTLITGTVEYEDDSLYLAAKRELHEEGGVLLQDSDRDRWIFLGPVYTDKNSDKIIPMFAVDITGFEINKPIGDGSLKESLSSFHKIDVSDVAMSDESLVLAAFLRLFNFKYNQAFGNGKSKS